MTHLKGYMMVIGAAVLWGLSATAAKFLLVRQVDALLIVQMRVTVSLLILLVIFGAAHRAVLRVDPRDLWRFALLGVLGLAGSTFCYYVTIRESTVATAIVIQYTAPLLVLAYGALTGAEQIAPLKVAAAGLSLLGCFLAVGAYDARLLRISPLGLATGAGSVFSWAFLVVYTRRMLVRYGLWTVTIYSVGCATLFWMLINPPWALVRQLADLDMAAALVGLAIVSLLIPHTLYTAGLRHVVPSRALITSTLEPVVAIVSAAAIMGEVLAPVQTAGAVIVIAAIVLLQMRREQEDLAEVGNAP